MITDQDVERSTFQSLLENLYSKPKTDDPLYKIKQKAWQQFLLVGLPSKKEDVYRYIRLKKFFSHSYAQAKLVDIAKETITPHVLPECENSLLVFVNGYFSPKLSRLQAIQGQITISLLSEAMGTYSGFLNSQWNRILKEEKDPFALLNLATQSEGAFIYISPDTLLEAPIQILHIVDTHLSPMLLMPRIQCFIGARSQVTIASTQSVISGLGYGVNSVVELFVEESSHVQFIQSACDLHKELWSLDALRAILKRSSSLKVIAATNGSETIRHDYRVSLIGENAEVSLSGVWKLEEKNEAHIHVIVDHQAPNCRSMQLFKGVLDDFSRSSFEGKILVQQAAQKTEAFQLNRNMLLSDRAHADSKPNLEIFADDVKASHGTTVGSLDQEAILYMKTRGISEKMAASLLVNGFCSEVVDKISIKSLQAKIRRNLCL